jgi:hypothetical protein
VSVRTKFPCYVLAPLVCGGLGAACGDGVEAPTPGLARVEITTEAGPPAGAIVTVRGSILEVLPESGTLYQRTAIPDSARLVLIGTAGEALRFRMRTADRTALPEVTVDALVSSDNRPVSRVRGQVITEPGS